MFTVNVDELPSSKDSSLLKIVIGNYVDDIDVDCGFSFKIHSFSFFKSSKTISAQMMFKILNTFNI